MSKAELKTKKNEASVTDFIDAVPHEGKRADAHRILEMMREVSGEEPKMWGGSIIGFGDVHLKYESGRELDWFKIGFSPRKANISLYLMSGFAKESGLLPKLGKHKMGAGCLYINKLADVDEDILRQLMEGACKSNQTGC